jgi:hypothetical protein
MIRDNADLLEKSAKCSGNIKCQQYETRSVCVARPPQCIGKNCNKNLWMSLTFLLQ